MYCFLFSRPGCKLSQVSAGSRAQPWMPLDPQQPNSHCYWLTAHSELLCVCSHSHLHWYESADPRSWAEAAAGTVPPQGRQAGRVGRYRPLSSPVSSRTRLLFPGCCSSSKCRIGLGHASQSLPQSHALHCHTLLLPVKLTKTVR